MKRNHNERSVLLANKCTNYIMKCIILLLSLKTYSLITKDLQNYIPHGTLEDNSMPEDNSLVGRLKANFRYISPN